MEMDGIQLFQMALTATANTMELKCTYKENEDGTKYNGLICFQIDLNIWRIYFYL